MLIKSPDISKNIFSSVLIYIAGVTEVVAWWEVIDLVPDLALGGMSDGFLLTSITILEFSHASIKHSNKWQLGNTTYNDRLGKVSYIKRFS